MTNDAPLWMIVSDTAYERAAKKFFRKHPDLIVRYAAVVEKLQTDPHDRSLRTHPLHGALHGMFGVTITESYRVIITIVVKEHEVHLLAIGDHDEAYR